jgi:hypothetical protein
MPTILWHVVRTHDEVCQVCCMVGGCWREYYSLRPYTVLNILNWSPYEIACALHKTVRRYTNRIKKCVGLGMSIDWTTTVTTRIIVLYLKMKIEADGFYYFILFFENLHEPVNISRSINIVCLNVWCTISNNNS